jgi:thioredoxin 1
MGVDMQKVLYLIMILILVAGLMFCSNNGNEVQQTKTRAESGSVSAGPAKDNAVNVNGTQVYEKEQIIFIELGSVNCIPCKKMQPVMKAIEEKYGDQIKIVFHDVWTDDGKPYAKKYKIRLIPTQIFVDTSGNEIMRHEGFFPEKEIDVFLQSHGLIVQ